MSGGADSIAARAFWLLSVDTKSGSMILPESNSGKALVFLFEIDIQFLDWRDSLGSIGDGRMLGRPLCFQPCNSNMKKLLPRLRSDCG